MPTIRPGGSAPGAFVAGRAAMPRAPGTAVSAGMLAARDDPARPGAERAA